MKPGDPLHSQQVTALGNTKLLERVSSGLVAIRNLFSQFDVNKDNVIERDEFSRVKPLCHATSADFCWNSASCCWVTSGSSLGRAARLSAVYRLLAWAPAVLGIGCVVV